MEFLMSVVGTLVAILLVRLWDWYHADGSRIKNIEISAIGEPGSQGVMITWKVPEDEDVCFTPTSPNATSAERDEVSASKADEVDALESEAQSDTTRSGSER